MFFSFNYKTIIHAWWTHKIICFSSYDCFGRRFGPRGTHATVGKCHVIIFVIKISKVYILVLLITEHMRHVPAKLWSYKIWIRTDVMYSYTLYDKLSNPYVKHVRDTKFSSIRRKTCMIFLGNLPPPSPCQLFQELDQLFEALSQ
jgi:hypothetical protein